MGKYVLKDCYVSVNNVDLSDHCSAVTIEDKATEVDFTAFTTAGYQEYGQGFKDATITATFYSDFAASSVHATIQPLYSSGGTFGVEIRPTSGTVSPTNPSAKMTSRIYSYSGIGGKLGDAAQFDAAFRNAGTAGLVWGTA